MLSAWWNPDRSRMGDWLQEVSLQRRSPVLLRPGIGPAKTLLAEADLQSRQWIKAKEPCRGAQRQSRAARRRSSLPRIPNVMQEAGRRVAAQMCRMMGLLAANEPS